MTARKSTPPAAAASSAIAPLLGDGTSVDWWFAFKFNAATYQGCAGTAKRKGIFGGRPRVYPLGWSQQYAYASSANPTLKKGKGCIGATLTDPVGATFNQVYNGSCNYVLWNDQFHGAPKIGGEDNLDSPWGHSKGMLAWDDSGNGFSLQVSTPSWPASGSANHPRRGDGNTLGTVKDDDIMVSQHFFALKLSKADVVAVLRALKNASVVTDPTNPQLVKNGGPADIQKLVSRLGVLSRSKKASCVTLSSGVKLISKPSKLTVPPWQMVSALLGSIPLRVASWWDKPEIYSTTARSKVGCWDASLGKPGAVDIAASGTWAGKKIGLEGGMGKNFNHAKIGVSTRARVPLTIFGDMNQQGALSPHYAYKDQKCTSSQNGRGGTFYAVADKKLWASVTALLGGVSAPTGAPVKTKPTVAG